jgi:predicted Zn-dependent protease
MGRELENANEWPVFQLELRPSGRPTKESADENFKTIAKQAEANPNDWKSAFALALAYDACGDRPRARKAMAEAMALRK